ncbi:hypothetical protein HMPREF9136_0761 [Prevotella dentalis DSM 3688]|uniref:Uncharacterized protein n=1 Tax=Prevotella dentalis (strain ATCC 49559 / DSM 3688 / JCM 13448 / NCTC 12043 / ES 2772) TaxID=908937 RepID=F9D1N3_PREDD|nr:hypothetical protein HMPREF9136_0761 [Prevotella dentalis DSM 3688]
MLLLFLCSENSVAKLLKRLQTDGRLPRLFVNGHGAAAADSWQKRWLLRRFFVSLHKIKANLLWH